MWHQAYIYWGARQRLLQKLSASETYEGEGLRME
jgi:hypothetical protein